jgi:hypothetical protein
LYLGKTESYLKRFFKFGTKKTETNRKSKNFGSTQITVHNNVAESIVTHKHNQIAADRFSNLYQKAPKE